MGTGWLSVVLRRVWRDLRRRQALSAHQPPRDQQGKHGGGKTVLAFSCTALQSQLTSAAQHRSAITAWSQVRRYGSGRRVMATVVCSSDVLDIAILDVADPDFWSGDEALGPLPLCTIGNTLPQLVCAVYDNSQCTCGGHSVDAANMCSGVS